ncbi:MAG: mechanosensitive ion channel [Deltaproteobacteria bacterium]|nr:mechanosensitive ion channel [Deltaproteobacteria bacterium]
MEDILTQVKEILAIYGIRIIAAVAIFIIGRWIAKGLRNLLRRMMTRGKVDETLISFICNLSYVALLAFVIIAALSKLGIQTTSLIAILGAASLAIGLALKGSLSNFAAGVMMIIFRPFKVGDFIEGGGTSGTVEEIQIFSTQLKTADNKTVIIPNAKIFGDKIVNYSTKGTRRVDMTFGIGYDDDIDKARSVILEIINGDERVLKDQAPVVAVSELADSTVNFTVRVWTKSGDYWGFLWDTTETVKKRFDAESIGIPYPQQDIHLYQHKS